MLVKIRQFPWTVRGMFSNYFLQKKKDPIILQKAINNLRCLNTKREPDLEICLVGNLKIGGHMAPIFC